MEVPRGDVHEERGGGGARDRQLPRRQPRRRLRRGNYIHTSLLSQRVES